MTQITLVALAGTIAVIISLMTGYRVWVLGKRRNNVPGSFQSSLPFALGSVGGLLVLLADAGHLASGDRFFTVPMARAALASLVFSIVALLIPWITRVTATETGGPKWILRSVFQLVAAGILVLGGVRFGIIGLGVTGQIDLGTMSWLITLIWIILATNLVRLLDGIDGAAPLLLIGITGYVLFGSITSHEFVLAGIAACALGAALGSLRFHVHPARISLRAPGSQVMGLMFAALTVLARQKSGATLLFILPLALIMLIIAGAALSFVEKGLISGHERPDDVQEKDD